MADFGNMLGSDEDSNEEDIDHIPKTPGPALISDREESEEERDEEIDEEEVNVKNKANDSESDSDSSDSESQSSVDENNRNSQNDSEVERSDNENEKKETNDVQSSDDNIDKSDNEEKIVNESHDNDSEDEDVIRRRVINKNKRKFDPRNDLSSDESNESQRIDKKQKLDVSDNEENDEIDGEIDAKSDEEIDAKSDEEIDAKSDEEIDTKNAKSKDIFGDMSSEDEDEDNDREKDGINADEKDKHSDKDSSVDENADNERRFDDNSNEGMANNNETVGEQSFIEDEEPAEEPIPETRIEVEIPRIVADLGKEIHFVKLPNFLSIDTHPYDPQWYEDEIDEDEIQDDEGRARLKLKVENTIRWRNVYDKETAETKKESNARVVRWSDGSLSLYLGEEIFDIHKLQLMPGDNNHLFIRQGTGLQGQTVFRTKLTFRPFSTESFTHRKLTLSLADRSQKTQKIRVLPNVGKDPEAHRSEMIKKEEDRLKASIRRENKQKRVRERSLVRGPTASYLEPDGDEDDEEEGISISKIKNQFKRNSYTGSKYPEEADSGEESKPANDDDDSDLEFDKKTDVKKKSVQIVESDED